MNKGFTLLEVLIVLMILAVLTTLTSTTIQNSVSFKSKIQKSVDQAAALRNAVAVMERDISLAFNYRDPNLEIQSALRKKRLEQNPELAQTERAEPPPPVKVTQFQGEKETLMFTSLSGVRITPGSQEIDQVEVGYELKSCRSPFEKEKNMKCLFRRVATEIDDNLQDGGESTAILENVTDFSLRYLGEGKDDWVDLWKTGEGADGTTKDNFPYAVEITVETEDKEKKLKLVTVAQLRFPNNPSKKVNNEPLGSSR